MTHQLEEQFKESARPERSSFPRVSVASVAIPVIGGTPSRNVSDYWRGAIKWAAAKDIVNARGRYIYTTDESIKEEGLENSAAKVLPKGTVIITARGTVGAIVQLGEDMAFNQTCYALVAKEAIFPDFLYYALKGSLLEMRALTYGTVFDTITTKSFDQLQIPLPSLSEQRAIVHILGSLDDKIELNRRMNETLEAMARAIFKSWFVDFDPVRAKMEGRQLNLPFPLGEGRSKGLDAETAALFPNSFEDSPLGKIPKGWRVSSFDGTIELIGGGTPKTSVIEYWGGNIPWFSVVDAPSSSDVFVIDTEKKITRKGLAESSTQLLPEGTTIISARGTVGKCALVGVPMAMNQSCYGVRGKDRRGSYFTYFALRNLVSELQRSTHGSVFDTITRDTFKAVQTTIVPIELTCVFDEKVAPLLGRILMNLRESRTLAAIRDALLPKLLSGEIRVKDAEKFMRMMV